MRQKGMDFARFIKWYKSSTNYSKEEFDDLLSEDLDYLKKIYKTISKYRITERGLSNLLFSEAYFSLSELYYILEVMEFMPISPVKMVSNMRKKHAFPIVDTNFNSLNDFKEIRSMYTEEERELPSKENKFQVTNYHKDAIRFARINSRLLEMKLDKDPNYLEVLKNYEQYVLPYEDKLYKDYILDFLLLDYSTSIEAFKKFKYNAINADFLYNLYLSCNKEKDRFYLTLNKVYNNLTYEEEYSNLKVYYENIKQGNKYVPYDKRVLFENQEKVLQKKLKRKKILEEFNSNN